MIIKNKQRLLELPYPDDVVLARFFLERNLGVANAISLSGVCWFDSFYSQNIRRIKLDFSAFPIICPPLTTTMYRVKTDDVVLDLRIWNHLMLLTITQTLI